MQVYNVIFVFILKDFCSNNGCTWYKFLYCGIVGRYRPITLRDWNIYWSRNNRSIAQPSVDRATFRNKHVHRDQPIVQEWFWCAIGWLFRNGFGARSADCSGIVLVRIGRLFMNGFSARSADCAGMVLCDWPMYRGRLHKDWSKLQNQS